ncbi:unnamed protein product [Coregonus sp. 'balchen']|nr:unnamed protein product [Coregonus sp. 'balchen']
MGRHGGVGLAVFVLVLVMTGDFVVHLNTFGFFANGTLDVNVLSLTLPEDDSKHPAEETEVCPLSKQNSDEPLFLFLIDTNNLRVNVKSYGDQDSVLTKLKTNKTLNKDSEAPEDVKVKEQKKDVKKVEEEKKDGVMKEGKEENKDGVMQEGKEEKKDGVMKEGKEEKKDGVMQEGKEEKKDGFHMVIGQLDEGLYNLNFHYCDNILPGINHPFNLNVEVTEKNPGGYLSAAEIPLPHLYIFMAGINYHFINTEGHPIEGWAVLANIAYIIIESTEEGSSEYALWKEVLFLVDLICCGAILFPVVWSIRHLQEASSTDGKAAMNLEKLKLFRHYYVMIVVIFYFTRIIASAEVTVGIFQMQWEFTSSAHAFQNPYLQLPLDEEDIEIDAGVTESGMLEGVSKVKKTSNGRERQKVSSLGGCTPLTVGEKQGLKRTKTLHPPPPPQNSSFLLHLKLWLAVTKATTVSLAMQKDKRQRTLVVVGPSLLSPLSGDFLEALHPCLVS